MNILTLCKAAVPFVFWTMIAVVLFSSPAEGTLHDVLIDYVATHAEAGR